MYSSYTYTTALGNRDINSWVPIDSGAEIYVDGYGMHITFSCSTWLPWEQVVTEQLFFVGYDPYCWCPAHEFGIHIEGNTHTHVFDRVWIHGPLSEYMFGIVGIHTVFQSPHSSEPSMVILAGPVRGQARVILRLTSDHRHLQRKPVCFNVHTASRIETRPWSLGDHPADPLFRIQPRPHLRWIKLSLGIGWGFQSQGWFLYYILPGDICSFRNSALDMRKP